MGMCSVETKNVVLSWEVFICVVLLFGRIYTPDFIQVTFVKTIDQHCFDSRFLSLSFYLDKSCRS